MDQAEKVLIEARAEAESTGTQRILWLILASLGEIEARRGNREASSAHRARAREIVEGISRRISNSKVRGSFLNLPSVRSVMVLE